MAHSQPFATLVYQHRPASSLSPLLPLDNGRQYSTFQWRGVATSLLHVAGDTTGNSLRQTGQNAFAAPSGTIYSNPFSQTLQPQLYTFHLDDMATEQSEQTEGSIGPHTRRPAPLQRIRSEISQDASLTFSAEPRRDPGLQSGIQFINLSPDSPSLASSNQSRDLENNPASQLTPLATSPPASEEPQSGRQHIQSTDDTSQTASSTLTLSSASISTPHRHRKMVVSNTDKARICRLRQQVPTMTQKELAERWAIDRSTVSKILKEKDRWLSIDKSEYRIIYRQRDTKFPVLEQQMQAWLMDCHRDRRPITDAAIRAKAKSLVPELVLTGEFKASAGWIGNFKRRNGVSGGRWSKTGSKSLDDRATGANWVATRRMAEQLGASVDLDPNHPESYLEREGALLRFSPTGNGADDESEEGSEAQDAEDNDDQMDVEPAVEQVTPPSSMVSQATSPHSTESSIMQDPMVVQEPTESSTEGADIEGSDGTASSGGDVAYDQEGTYDRQPETYTATAGPYPEYPEPGNYDTVQPIDEADMDPRNIGTASQVDSLLNTLLLWLKAQEGLLTEDELNTLVRIRHITVDYVTTGIVDRSRYI